MKKSGAYVEAPQRYEMIEGASHWIPLDTPDRLNALLLDWLRGPAEAGQLSVRAPSHLGPHNDHSGAA
jgi:hypothetical protein